MEAMRDAEKCEFLCVHEDAVARVRARMPDDSALCDLADLYKVFGDSTRVKILYALYDDELCVCDIAQLLGATPTAVSHQLRLLKANRLVKARRDGKNVFYALADDHVHRILGEGAEHVAE